jgi:hypothetical protein
MAQWKGGTHQLGNRDSLAFQEAVEHQLTALKHW